MTMLLNVFLNALDPWLFWLILGILFLVAEALTEALISIWFAAGSLIALILSLFGVPFPIQILVMLVVSTALLVLFVKKRASFHLTSPFKTRTNADRVIGERAEVIRTIDPIRGDGQVKVKGSVWSASSEHDRVIPQGSFVRVVEIRGVRLLVEPLSAETES